MSDQRMEPVKRITEALHEMLINGLLRGSAVEHGHLFRPQRLSCKVNVDALKLSFVSEIISS